MAGGLATNTPSVVSGWTAFGAPVRKSHTPPADDMKTTTAPTPQDLDDPNGDQAPASMFASPASQTQEAEDQAFFRGDSRELTGYILLDLCERHSISDIVDQINQAVGAEIISRPTLNSRLNSALVKKAKDEGTTKDEVRAALTERRKARGIRSTRRKPWSQQRSRLSTVTNASDFNAGPVNTRTGYSTQENSDADMDATNNSDALTPAQQQQADHAAFVDQQSLKGDAMLLMAERYTDVEISARICAIPGNFPLKEGGVANRIHDALKRKAQATGVTLEQVRADLNAARASNGIVRQTKLGKVTAAKTARKAKSEAVVQDDAADDAPVPTQLPEQTDDEMTDDDGTSSQQGWNADEVDAANTLLALFSDDSEVDEAASILMDMHRADASLAAQPKQMVDLTGKAASSDIDDVEMTAAAALKATKAFNANANANAHDVGMTDHSSNTYRQDQQAMYAAQEAYLVLLLAKSKHGEQAGTDVEMADSTARFRGVNGER